MQDLVSFIQCSPTNPSVNSSTSNKQVRIFLLSFNYVNCLLEVGQQLKHLLVFELQCILQFFIGILYLKECSAPKCCVLCKGVQISTLIGCVLYNGVQISTLMCCVMYNGVQISTLMCCVLYNDVQISTLMCCVLYNGVQISTLRCCVLYKVGLLPEY